MKCTASANLAKRDQNTGHIPTAHYTEDGTTHPHLVAHEPAEHHSYVHKTLVPRHMAVLLAKSKLLA